MHPSIIFTASWHACWGRGYRCYTYQQGPPKTLPCARKNVVSSVHISSHIHKPHLTDDRLENTSGANALMLMLDKIKLPDCVEHEPLLVSRPVGSARNMQSPKKATAPNPHRYRGLYLPEVSIETRAGTREQTSCLTRNNFVRA
jgi:hypothetical protein